jgi:hypothetical protein
MTPLQFQEIRNIYLCVGYWNVYHDIAGNNEELFIFDIGDGKYGEVCRLTGPYAINKEEITDIKEIETVTCDDKIYKKQPWMI